MSGDTNMSAFRSPSTGDFLFQSTYVCVARPRHKHRCIIVLRHKHMRIIAEIEKVGFVMYYSHAH